MPAAALAALDRLAETGTVATLVVLATHANFATRQPVAVVVRKPGRTLFLVDPRMNVLEVAAAALRLLTEEELSVARDECVATACSHARRLSMFGGGHHAAFQALCRPPLPVSASA